MSILSRNENTRIFGFSSTRKNLVTLESYHVNVQQYNEGKSVVKILIKGTNPLNDLEPASGDPRRRSPVFTIDMVQTSANKLICESSEVAEMERAQKSDECVTIKYDKIRFESSKLRESGVPAMPESGRGDSVHKRCQINSPTASCPLFNRTRVILPTVPQSLCQQLVLCRSRAEPTEAVLGLKFTVFLSLLIVESPLWTLSRVDSSHVHTWP